MTQFIPFSADAQETNLADLIIASDDQKIALYGELELRRDQVSLDRARRLTAMLNAIVADLEQQDSLPVKAATSPNPGVKTVNNPFGPTP